VASSLLHRDARGSNESSDAGDRASLHFERIRQDPARAAELRSVRARFIAADRIGAVRAVNGVLNRSAVKQELASIRTPTLVMVGEEDTATVPAKSEAIAAAIVGATLVRIPRAGHLSAIDNPAFVTEQLSSFLGSL